MPNNYEEESSTTNYLDNLRLILKEVLERNRNLILQDIKSFKEWMEFINYIHLGLKEERDAANQIVQEHVFNVMRLSEVRVGLVGDIVHEWIFSRVANGSKA